MADRHSRNVVAIQIIVEIQDPETRDEIRIETSDKRLLLRSKVRIVQHRNRIQGLFVRRFVLDVFREGLLLLPRVVDRVASGDIAVESGGQVLYRARLWFAVHADDDGCAAA